MKCPYCGSENIYKQGFTTQGNTYTQFYNCRDCKTEFSLTQRDDPKLKYQHIKKEYQNES